MLLSRRVAAAASSAALAVALSACDADQIGAAAVVGDERITVAELQDHVRQVVAMTPDADVAGDQTAVQSQVLDQAIRFELNDHIADDAGITVTEAEIDAFIADQLLPQLPEGDLTPVLAQNALTEETLRDRVRQQLIFEKIGGDQAYLDALIAASDSLGVEVNPRYGTWDGASLSQASGSISVSVDESTQ